MGGENGVLHQYQKKSQGDSFALVKNFGNIEMSHIVSCCLAGDLAIFGGYKSCLRAVKISTQELLKGTVKTAYKYVRSLETCRVSESIIVSVGGQSPSYSDICSDVFEVKVPLDSYNLSEFELGVDSDTDTFQSGPESGLIDMDSVSKATLSEKIISSFLSKVFVYIEALFRNFTKSYEREYKCGAGRVQVSL